VGAPSWESGQRRNEEYEMKRNATRGLDCVLRRALCFRVLGLAMEMNEYPGLFRILPYFENSS
jgi:hypothetical protein